MIVKIVLISPLDHYHVQVPVFDPDTTKYGNRIDVVKRWTKGRCEGFGAIRVKKRRFHAYVPEMFTQAAKDLSPIQIEC
jgi:hypothetical protein